MFCGFVPILAALGFVWHFDLAGRARARTDPSGGLGLARRHNEALTMVS
jgi:hypothetical protein